MRSRRRLIATLLAVVSAVWAKSSIARAADPKAIGSGLPASFDLKKQLETGLKARRPVDFEYIAMVVDKVENGDLPRTVVDQAFLYARKRSSRVPIIYFQFSLKELAKKAGVTL